MRGKAVYKVQRNKKTKTFPFTNKKRKLCKFMDKKYSEKNMEIVGTIQWITENNEKQWNLKNPQKYSQYLGKLFIHKNIWILGLIC